MCEPRFLLFVLALVSVWGLSEKQTTADGKLFAPRDYQGSLEEQSQEAIIVFSQGDEKTSAVEDLILKIRVVGPVDPPAESRARLNPQCLGPIARDATGVENALRDL